MFKHYFLYSLVGLILAGIVFSRVRASGSKETSPNLAPPVVESDGVLSVGALRLWRDYEENEVTADNKYLGQRLRVTGTVLSIQKDYSGRAVLEFMSGNPIFRTMATLDSVETQRAGSIAKGEVVTVQCVGAARMMRMPQLERCRIK